MPASERLDVSVLPVSGSRLSWSFVKNFLSTLVLWAWNDDWPPVDVVVTDRTTGAAVFRHRAWGQLEGQQMAERLRRDVDALPLERFLTEWDLSLDSDGGGVTGPGNRP